jgi:hypothetical protein
MTHPAIQSLREVINRIGKLRDVLQGESNHLSDLEYGWGIYGEYENGAEEANQIGKQLEKILPALEAAIGEGQAMTDTNRLASYAETLKEAAATVTRWPKWKRKRQLMRAWRLK